MIFFIIIHGTALRDCPGMLISLRFKFPLDNVKVNAAIYIIAVAFTFADNLLHFV